ncbi:hypothetical protein RhiirC2_100255 [Rhizophagus irregularis]|uniref:Uncharacterized protein n=1 Tax=Rhizophagus irregularis TaxID=588596 RepID=A0A2N1MS94_9GLOM|nr:hypothetical protein RhiirC2_100255 [Rhizophagus irregularis]
MMIAETAHQSHHVLDDMHLLIKYLSTTNKNKSKNIQEEKLKLNPTIKKKTRNLTLAIYTPGFNKFFF